MQCTLCWLIGTASVKKVFKKFHFSKQRRSPYFINDSVFVNTQKALLKQFYSVLFGGSKRTIVGSFCGVIKEWMQFRAEYVVSEAQLIYHFHRSVPLFDTFYNEFHHSVIRLTHSEHIFLWIECTLHMLWYIPYSESPFSVSCDVIFK